MALALETRAERCERLGETAMSKVRRHRKQDIPLFRGYSRDRFAIATAQHEVEAEDRIVSTARLR